MCLCDTKILTITFLQIQSLLSKANPNASPRMSWPPRLWAPSNGQQCRMMAPNQLHSAFWAEIAVTVFVFWVLIHELQGEARLHLTNLPVTPLNIQISFCVTKATLPVSFGWCPSMCKWSRDFLAWLILLDGFPLESQEDFDSARSWARQWSEWLVMVL